MSVEINIHSNVREVERSLSMLERRQMPFAISTALNDSTRDSRVALQKHMGKVFDKPVARTLRSVKIKTGTKAKPVTSIWIDDEPGKGIAPAKYLMAEIFGGVRHQKRFERALQAKGLMPPGTFAVPGPGAPLDGSGNIPGSFIVQLLSYFAAFSEQGYRANMTQKRKAKIHGIKRSTGGYKTIGGVMYFVANGRGRSYHLAPGIYKKTGIHGVDITPLILFVKSPAYTVRLQFEKIVEGTVRTTFPVRLRQRLATALATAR